MAASSPSQTVFSIGYDFHAGNGNNGNVWNIYNYRDRTRDQSFAYDGLNRLISAQNAGTNCAAMTVNGKTEYWGNNYGYDPWGNLVNKTITKCGAENFSVAALSNNQLSGYSYDAAGNMTHDLTSGMTYSYDQENRITGANGYTYTYDADGNRVKKSNGSTGTLYWYMSPGIVAESDLAGNLKSEYVFFDGERVARRDFGTPGGVFYYFSDHLKTASVITDSAGNIKAESDYYPWGGELQFVNSDTNHYKFTSKERDSETGLDYFGARYYSNALARFITPDWASKAVDVPYAEFSDPQSLNLYSYVRNIPTVNFDGDGHDWRNALDYSIGVVKGVASSVSFGYVGAPSANDSLASLSGQLAGSLAVTHISATTLEASGPAAVAGLVAAPETGGTSLVVSGGAVVAAAVSSATAVGGAKNVGAVVAAMSSKASNEKGSYTNTHESGKLYHGKGDRARSQDSARDTEKKTGDKHTATEFKPSANDREAFKDESRRIEADGGPKSSTNYNKIDSPGTNYRKQDGSK